MTAVDVLIAVNDAAPFCFATVPPLEITGLESDLWQEMQS